MIGYEDVRAAADRIGSAIVRTPMEHSPELSERCGVEVWLKLECFQRTGSFKLRGALNAVLTMSDAERARGVMTASAGNHGLGLAYAGRRLGVPVTVVVAETASAVKVAALRRSGAELILRGDNYDAAEQHALELAQSSGMRFVSAYNDPGVISGGGTVGLEVLEELPRTRALIVPAGGGGLIGGIALAARAHATPVSVIGVQSVASPALYAAKRDGGYTRVDVAPSLADGLAGNVEPDSMTLDLVRDKVDAVVLVDEAAIAHAMRWLVEHERVLVEGSAATAVAAVLTDAVRPVEGPVVLVLTGRNVATSVVREHVLGAAAR